MSSKSSAEITQFSINFKTDSSNIKKDLNYWRVFLDQLQKTFKICLFTISYSWQISGRSCRMAEPIRMNLLSKRMDILSPIWSIPMGKLKKNGKNTSTISFWSAPLGSKVNRIRKPPNILSDFHSKIAWKDHTYTTSLHFSSSCKHIRVDLSLETPTLKFS